MDRLTRRSFLSGAAGAAAIGLSPALGLRSLWSAARDDERPFLRMATEAWAWLDASRIPTGAGATWPADPMDSASTGWTLYTHGPGVLPFALELFHTTEDETYLEAAIEGARHLAAELPAVEGAGLYTGLAGIAFGLTETHRATGEDRHRADAERAARLLVERAQSVGAGVAWPQGSGEDAIESNDIVSGTAGTGLGLLYLHRELGVPGALETAEAAGRRLLERAVETDEGRRWDMWPGFPREMPNFSHGTAGMAYFLATLHRATGGCEFLDAALDGARYVTSQATVEGGAGAASGYRLFHSRPGGEDLYYLSWCHGPVGTNRLFHQLGEITGDGVWRDWVERGARGVMSTGIPEERPPGFWENISQCCGTAGAAEYFLTLHRRTGQAEYRAFTDRLNADLEGRSTAEGGGRKWIQAEHRVRPELLVAQTGFMQGAAGVGKYFLHMDAMEERGEGPRVILPDDLWFRQGVR
ncbi:lanthionine synthetase LanC family protein [Candidatus Palauibacter sp.]|uniref:lanthionine synthetase LanC family protein n=1 Tax=Candidatus Palauibacter sp. TaxID=3101350 RepID=UPI003B02AD25